MRRYLPDDAATRRLGADLAAACPERLVVYLKGELGAGKSTLVRGYLAARGHTGRVKSPTYTLIEPYEVGGGTVLHLDLYRLADPGELEYLGIRDLADADTSLLVEWPEQGEGYLPAADIVFRLGYRDHAREAVADPLSARGRTCLDRLETLSIPP